MPSLIQGYEYDIFISYRQKDNKYDGWVTEFVDNLKKELEATFKEDISVYFDINPHDGLLETHEVGDSLREKLKCVVFIPIISRTYCDPKSFAWENELKAFVDYASNDSYGLKVKLPNGNIASRVLPVRIHDLDNADIKLCESVLGGVMRGVEFIYKSAGVNRPLRLKEENPQENINHTIYRDQINKVANAVKEIITGLISAETGEKPGFSEEVSEQKEVTEDTIFIEHKKRRTGIIIGLVLIIFVGSLFVFQFLEKKNSKEKQPEKSIAVLVFHNFSMEQGQETMCDALTNEIINNLYKVKSFDRVVPFPSVLVYKNSDKNPTSIASELRATYILYGTYHKVEDSLKLSVTLIEPGSDKILWQKDYKELYKNKISIQSDIALQIASNVNAFISDAERQYIGKIPTSNMEAYDLIQKANLFATDGTISVSQGLDSALKAIRLDSNYADAYSAAGIFSMYSAVSPVSSNDMQGAIKNAYPYIKKALEIDPENSLAHFAMGNIYEWGEWDYISAEKEYLKVNELAPNIATAGVTDLIAEFFIKMDRQDMADAYFNKSQDVRTFMGGELYIKSLISEGRTEEALHYLLVNSGYLKEQPVYFGTALIWKQDYDSAKFYFENALKSDHPQMKIPRYISELALAYFKTGETSKAQLLVDQLKGRSLKTLAGSPEYFVGWYYSGAGNIDSAFIWLNKAYENRSPEMPWLKKNPVFSILRKDKRYWDLYAKTGHKAYDDYMAGMKK